MNDRTISANTVASAALWVIGGLLIVSDLVNVCGDQGNGLSGLGLLLAMGGAVLTIRGFFCDQRMRERAAFDLGCETGHAEGPVLRKV